ncbi:coenzyme F420-0:L-glutamate ligase [Nocardioides sp.]|jgi:coenzyme F420-0:L-glutamate ligase/coenzyme F420-1:gamma-L-glutamate ligase|uniref:coenzyme F420-0:L-glutamate ligase n=1 Tax=Nocardioides sp. TaxID=35761 RepID=UPI002BF763CE|nr:coenzyme F420-0:L-glutamate ligase [Nocardioides sp.]HVX53388.1 coenzyme F420-0:L-glutamate ligase [Nocardioides sp.]
MITVHAPDGVGDVRTGDDLAALLLPLVELADGDIVVVTSKVVAKAEGQVRASTREAELPGETRRVVARRGATTIVRNRLGLTMAAAGIDASNVEPGHVVLLPADPDASARRLRTALAERAGVNVGVVVTDTAGRAWREGQVDIAIGAAGVLPLESFAGRVDGYGNDLVVTAPAIADELAGLAELAGGKLAGRPFALVRGRADLVMPVGEDGPGATSLIRPEGRDFFGYGAREAVLRALTGRPEDRTPFGAPADHEEMAAAIAEATGGVAVPDGEGLTVDGADPTALAALAFAFGWTVEAADRGITARMRPLTP